MKRIMLIAKTMLTITMLMAGAVSMTHAQESLAMDLALSLPKQVVIERVDAAAGTIVIDGQSYTLSNGNSSLFGLPPEASQRALNPRLLRTGMEVMIVTDGIEPTRDYQPLILAIWRPQ